MLSVHNLDEHMGSAFSQTQHIRNGYQLLKEIGILFHEYDASFNHLRGTQFTSLNRPNAQCLNRARMIYVAYSLEITVYQYKNMGGLLYTSQKTQRSSIFYIRPQSFHRQEITTSWEIPTFIKLEPLQAAFLSHSDWFNVINSLPCEFHLAVFMKESVLF